MTPMQSPPDTRDTNAQYIPLPPSPCPSLSTSSSASPPLSPSPPYPSSPSFPPLSPSPSSSFFLPPLLHPPSTHTPTPPPLTNPTNSVTYHEDTFYQQVQLPIVLQLLRFRARYLYRDSLDARILMDAVEEYFELVVRVIGGDGECDEEQIGDGEGDGDADGDYHACEKEEEEKQDLGKTADTVHIADEEQDIQEADLDATQSNNSSMPDSSSHTTLTTSDFHHLLHRTLIPPPHSSDSYYTDMHTHLLDGWSLYTTHLLLLCEHSPRAAETYRTWEGLGDERRERFLSAAFGVATPRGLRDWVGNVKEGREGVGNEDLEVRAVGEGMGEFWREGGLEVLDGETAVRWDHCGRAYAQEALFGLRREVLLAKLDRWIACIPLPGSDSEVVQFAESNANAGQPELRQYLLQQIRELTEDAQGTLTLDMDVEAWADFLAALLFRRIGTAEVPVSANNESRLQKQRQNLALLGVLLARDRLVAVLEGRDDDVAKVMRMQVAVLVRRLVLELVDGLSIREDGATV